MVATKQQNNPFEYCDVLSMSTWKSLRGARGSLIFSNKKSKKDPEIEKKINSAVFPTLQGTASMHQIAGICSQLGEVCTPAYKEYISQVISNAKTLGVALEKKNYEIITQGTENHMILWDFRKTNFHGNTFLFELIH
jgi:glycine hydroxymethyltransferase